MKIPEKPYSEWKRFYSYQDGELCLMFRRNKDVSIGEKPQWMTIHDYWVKNYKANANHPYLVQEPIALAAYPGKRN